MEHTRVYLIEPTNAWTFITDVAPRKSLGALLKAEMHHTTRFLPHIDMPGNLTGARFASSFHEFLRLLVENCPKCFTVPHGWNMINWHMGNILMIRWPIGSFPTKKWTSLAVFLCLWWLRLEVANWHRCDNSCGWLFCYQHYCAVVMAVQCCENKQQS